MARVVRVGVVPDRRYARAPRGCSSRAEPDPSKVVMPVRLRSPALRPPRLHAWGWHATPARPRRSGGGALTHPVLDPGDPSKLLVVNKGHIALRRCRARFGVGL